MWITYGKLVIKTAQASAIVSGENSRVYNGEAISTANIVILCW